MAHLHEDALREYDELELCYLETGSQRLVSFSIASVVYVTTIVLNWEISFQTMRMDKKLFGIIAVNMTGKQKDFGGLDKGDDQAALVNPAYKALTQIVQDDSFREFEFRQYLFACQSKVCPSWESLITQHM